jgi:nicotinamidase-related amidase
MIHVQERLLPAMHDSERIVDRSLLLLRAAEQLKVPIVASEQYPKGLGRTVAPLAAHIPSDSIVEKVEFSLAAAPGGVERLRANAREQVVVTGIEAHVCVLQTAVDLNAKGFAVSVVADAVGSRHQANAALALDRLRRLGIEIVSTEMVVFEWLGRAGTADFQVLSKLLR